MSKSKNPLIFAILILLLFYLRWQKIPKVNLKNDQLVKVVGSLTEEPQISENRQKFNLGQFEIWGNRYPEYHYGDELEAVGEVKLKAQYLGQKKYLLDSPKIRLINVTKTTSITKLAIDLKIKLKSLFVKYFPKPLDGLMAGIVLGDKNLLPTDFWKKLQQTGTLHIMVASGMNIAMFSNGLLSFLMLFFRRRIAICFLIIMIWYYSIMTGLQAPVIRASTLICLIYLSNIVGREAEVGRVLLLTGLLMIFVNPFWLWDIGFQLSFLATMGLVYVQPVLKKKIIVRNENLKSEKLQFKAKNFKLFVLHLIQSDNFLSSVAAQIATLPILLINFGQFNVLSPIINLIILWAIPYILQIGIFIGLAGLLWTRLGEIASYLLFPFLFFIEQSINLFAKIKIFQLEVPKISWWWTVIYYFVLWWWIQKKNC